MRHSAHLGVVKGGMSAPRVWTEEEVVPVEAREGVDESERATTRAGQVRCAVVTLLPVRKSELRSIRQSGGDARGEMGADEGPATLCPTMPNSA